MNSLHKLVPHLSMSQWVSVKFNHLFAWVANKMGAFTTDYYVIELIVVIIN